MVNVDLVLGNTYRVIHIFPNTAKVIGLIWMPFITYLTTRVSCIYRVVKLKQIFPESRHQYVIGYNEPKGKVL